MCRHAQVLSVKHPRDAQTTKRVTANAQKCNPHSFNDAQREYILSVYQTDKWPGHGGIKKGQRKATHTRRRNAIVARVAELGTPKTAEMIWQDEDKNSINVAPKITQSGAFRNPEIGLFDNL